MYSLFGLGISWGRGTEDELNTIAAGTLTGLLYKSSGELIINLLGILSIPLMLCRFRIILRSVQSVHGFEVTERSLWAICS